MASSGGPAVQVYTFSLRAAGHAEQKVRCPVTFELPPVRSALCETCTAVCPLPFLMPKIAQSADGKAAWHRA